MKLHIIGDVHGMFEEYYIPMLAQIGEEPSIQLGDMGHGFPNTILPVLPKQHRFIRGNHDNPEPCRKHPNYLGDFGYIEEWGLFYISGALSVDKEYRIEGVSWWEEEELFMREANAALKLYEETKPRVVLSHDCPEIAKIKLLIYKQGSPHIWNIPSRTNQLLQAMFDIHQPSTWYFAHYHISRTFSIHNTLFKCLNEVEKTTIDV
jgi:hypothetical protein